MSISNLVRECVMSFPEYIPGEQMGKGFVKLNTNESPFAIPKSIVAEAQHGMLSSLQLYPEPKSESLRAVAATVLGVDGVDNVLVGNGSSDILSLIYRAFVGQGDVVAMPAPGFTLNRDLAAIQGARFQEVPWDDGYKLPISGLIKQDAKLIVIANPNNPTSTCCPLEDIQQLADIFKGLIVIDEAYAEFSGMSAVPLIRAYPRVVVSQSFSKSFSAAGVRLGIALGGAEAISFLHKVQNIYAVGRPTQALGIAILRNRRLFDPLIRKIVAQRDIMMQMLTDRGFQCAPSSTNFLFAKVPEGTGGDFWYKALKERMVLVRYFGEAELRDYLRITVGCARDTEQLMDAIDGIREAEERQG
jgi:histidinol-phosphate aminotransferase